MAREDTASMSGAHIPQPPVYRITLAQLGFLLPSCLVLYWYHPVAALSALAGGLIAILPQAFFAARLFRHRGARSAQQVARSGYAGEVGKFALSAAGFALVFATMRPISGLAVFTAYLLMMVMQIAGGWWLMRRPVGTQQTTKQT